MQPIFSRNPDIDKMAFMNWRIEDDDHVGNMINIADGYMRSSIALAEVCIADNRDKKADIIIFPILNNLNHAIELYFKAMNWCLNRILQNSRQLEGRHNIKQIYQTVRSKLKLYNGQITVRYFDKEFRELKAYIDELYSKTEACSKNDKMDFSRYPLGGDDEDHFYVGVMGTVHIDLENFVNRFEKLHERLHRMSQFLYYNEVLQDDGWSLYD